MYLSPAPTQGQIANRWRAAVDRAVAPLGLTHAQYVLLGSLSGLARTGVRPSQRELADYSGLDVIYDGPITLTGAGTSLHAGLTATVARSTGQLYAGLNPGDLEVARRVLKEITERAGRLQQDY